MLVNTNNPPMGVPHPQNTTLSFTRLLELILVSLLVIVLLCLASSLLIGQSFWQSLIIPFILAGVPLFVASCHGENLGRLGLNLQKPALSVKLLIGASCAIFPILFGGAWLIRFLNLNLSIPLLPQITSHELTAWIIYQFLYVAVSEEIFFRGFILGRLLNLKISDQPQQQQSWEHLAVVISALVFAIVHVIITGSSMALATFFPGLLLGWLFLRTRSLLAPIIFHALANTAYALIAVYILT